ncbi:MAG: hypothetical protein JWO56_2626 [Acidobacteria bacterium]|nr:hypothetical protein [Acidobacteriota bacterium]
MAILRRALLASSMAFLAACGMRGPVASRVTIAPNDDPKRITITVVTDIDSHTAGPAMDARVADIREALANGRDEWTPRFTSVQPESERNMVERKYGQVRHVEHSATFDADELQRFFSDTGMTLTLTRVGTYRELAIYPGTSSRATRQQRERVQKLLTSWSEEAARYFQAVDRLYVFMSAHPQRAEGIFDMIVGERQEPLNDEERVLVDSVNDAMDHLSRRLQAEEQDSMTVDEEFDLVFNPFSAEVAVQTPDDLLFVEHMEKRASNLAVIHRDGLLDAMSALEGRWISPDPLAILLRSSLTADSKPPSAATVAAMPRRSNPAVTASEIEKAVRQELQPAAVYRVRW